MKKPVLLVPAMHCREMIDGPDLDRLLASGSYLVATKPKKPNAHAVNQRNYMRRHSEAGYKILHTLVPEHVYTLLLSRLRKGESMASLLERLLKSVDDSDDNQLSDRDN